MEPEAGAQLLVANTSPGVSASGSSTEVLIKHEKMRFFLDVTGVAATSPVTTLDVDIETKDPGSGDWRVIESFAQALGVTSERIPAAANERAMASPIPLAPPVMNATFPSRSCIYFPRSNRGSRIRGLPRMHQYQFR